MHAVAYIICFFVAHRNLAKKTDADRHSTSRYRGDPSEQRWERGSRKPTQATNDNSLIDRKADGHDKSSTKVPVAASAVAVEDAGRSRVNIFGEGKPRDATAYEVTFSCNYIE